LDLSPEATKAKAKEAKINYWDVIKLKSFCPGHLGGSDGQSSCLQLRS